METVNSNLSNFENDVFLKALPSLTQYLSHQMARLAEIHFDLGRPPRAIWLTGESEILRLEPVTLQEFKHAIEVIGPHSFDGNNRAGIDRTLHRFSVLRNRQNDPIGLSCRFGRALPGLAPGLSDVVAKGGSILLIGRPGVGKTCTLRGLIAMFAEDPKHRVMVVDTNNEIGGDGDVPHSFLGMARRIQVPEPSLQHLKMIEAVSNHMPTVVAIDEVKTEQEANAAREIAQRGVIVLATVHGDNLLAVQQNPTVNALLGGMKASTVGDNLAKKQPGGFQKNVVQRLHDVPFKTAIVLKDRSTAAIHWTLTADIDKGWLFQEPRPENRLIQTDESGTLVKVARISNISLLAS